METEFKASSVVSPATLQALSGSAIRKMFTLGQELRAKFGENNVFDFSLGNPALEPPPEFQAALVKVVNEKPKLSHGYMPNQGLPECRSAVARLMTKLQRVPVNADRVVMSVGAAGGMNVVLRTILAPGDEVIKISPYFVDYNTYITANNGVPVTVQTLPNYEPDLNDMRSKITAKTRAVIMNSPNNPTGKVYSQECVNALGELLKEKSSEFGRPIYLISDDPYARLIYNGKVNHSTFEAHTFSFVVSSLSKDLSIPGERLGYIVGNPSMPHWADVKSGLIQWTRGLGYVNAPALMQRAVSLCIDHTVDIEWYAVRRDKLCDGLRAAGLELDVPEGAFYAFPKTPLGMPAEVFTELLAEENVIVVPGTPFGMPNNVRLCYAVTMETIEGALPRIQKVMGRILKP